MTRNENVEPFQPFGDFRMGDFHPIPTPIEGIAIGRSGIKTFGSLLLAVVMLLFGLMLVWVKLTDGTLDEGYHPKKVTWWGLILGIGMVIGAPFMAYSLLRAVWVRRRVVTASDRLQIVEHLDGNDVVILQIPFSNMKEFRFQITSTERRLGIFLRRLDDQDTYAPSEKFESNRELSGWHFCITSGYEGGARAITTELERAYENWKSIELELD